MELFILKLPPINLHTANLIWPYYNGIEYMRLSLHTVPSIVNSVGDKIHPKAQTLVAQRNSNMVKQCNFAALSHTTP